MEICGLERCSKLQHGKRLGWGAMGDAHNGGQLVQAGCHAGKRWGRSSLAGRFNRP
ncbi:hypothetical protein GQ54DRAFT_195871 [Martensiomyces pterosporus]|nr:hypothetical protein GQ54DRAFT_195871 [Martensiomyces pterosporus]